MSHELTIAKAALLATLIRPDPVPLSRDNVDSFHSSLHTATLRCSPGNIQTCKSWLLKNIVRSSSRTEVLGKYLTALAESFQSVEQQVAEDKNRPRDAPPPHRRLSSRRKQLHLLYLLHDTLHHAKQYENGECYAVFSTAIQPALSAILQYAASCDPTLHPKLHKRLADLLRIWEESSYFTAETISQLQKISKEAYQLSKSEKENKAKNGKKGSDSQSAGDITKKGKEDITSQWRDAPYLMPAMHGDSSAPYHELPAANLLPLIVPNSSTPIQPSAVKPLQLTSGSADTSLVDAMKKFFRDVDRIYATEDPFLQYRSNGEAKGDLLEEEEDGTLDIDELGQIVLRDQITGDIIDGETYYGWSRGFCQKMKKRREARDASDRGNERGRTRRSRSLSSFSSSSSIASRSPARDYGRGRGDHRRSRRHAHSRSYSPSRSDSRSRSGRRHTSQRDRHTHSRSRSPSRSRAPSSRNDGYGAPRSYSPRRDVQKDERPPQPPTAPMAYQQTVQQQQQHPHPPPSLPGPQQPFPMPGGNFPAAPSAMPPFIPPPPPNWSGPWPPPPPPLPMPFGLPPFPVNTNMNMNLPMPMPMPGFGQGQQQQQQPHPGQGRGLGGYPQGRTQ